MAAYRTIKGDRMEAGFLNDTASRRFHVAVVDGLIYEYDAERHLPETHNPPLVVDVDGHITRDGAAAGYGFLPDAGEIERLASLGIVFPSKATPNSA